MPCPDEGRALEGARRGDSRRSGGGDAPPRPAGPSRRHPARLVRWPMGTRRSVRGGGPSRSASGAPAVRHQRWIPRSVHRGSTEQASNTARGTPKVRRTCGSNNNSASLGVARRRGPWVRHATPAFRAPSFFQASANDQTNGRSGARSQSPGGAALAYCVMLEVDSVARHQPSPLWGGSRAKRAGWGGSRARRPAPAPSPQGGGEPTAAGASSSTSSLTLRADSPCRLRAAAACHR